MHYLMLEKSDLENIIACCNLTVLKQVEACVTNFVELYGRISQSKSFSDMTQASINSLKECTGLESALRLKKLVSDVTNGTSKLTPDVLVKVKSIIESNESYNSACYFSSEDGSTNVRLTTFQERLLHHIASKFSEDGDLELGLQIFNTTIERLRSSFKSPTLWNTPITSIMNRTNKLSLFSMIEPNIIDLRNKAEGLKIFKKQYLNDTDFFTETMKKIGSMYPEVIDNTSNLLENLINAYVNDIKWDYAKVNKTLGTNLSEYKMLLEINALQNMGFIGLWPTSSETEKTIKNAVITSRTTQLSKKDILSNENIKYILEVISPLIDGELKYLQEV